MRAVATLALVASASATPQALNTLRIDTRAHKAAPPPPLIPWVDYRVQFTGFNFATNTTFFTQLLYSSATLQSSRKDELFKTAPQFVTHLDHCTDNQEWVLSGIDAYHTTCVSTAEPNCPVNVSGFNIYQYVGNTTWAGFAANAYAAPSDEYLFSFIVTSADGFASPLFLQLSENVMPNAGVSIEQFNRFDPAVSPEWAATFDKPGECGKAEEAVSSLRGKQQQRFHRPATIAAALQAARKAGPAPAAPGGGFTAPTLPVIPNYRMRYTHANLSSELPDGADLGSQTAYNSAEAQVVRVDTTLAKPFLGYSFLRNISYCGREQKGYIEVGATPYGLDCSTTAEDCTVYPLDFSSLVYAGNVTLEHPGFPLFLYVNSTPTSVAQPFIGVAVSADGLLIPQIALLPAPEGQSDALIVHQFDAITDGQWYGAFDEPEECKA